MIIDSCSPYVVVDGLRVKSQHMGSIHDQILFLERQFDINVKTTRSGGAGELRALTF